MVTGFIPMLVFFMFRTKANGFLVMDIGHYYGLTIIGLSFRLTVCRGLIASIGPIWRICYLIVLCFVFGCLSFFVCLANSPTPQQWMLWSFFIFTLSRKMWRIVLCSAIVVFWHMYFEVIPARLWSPAGFFWNLPFHVRGQ